ncbi:MULTISPECIES: hypothetical protein [Oscillatoriales]|nr:MULTISPECIES: hypothetical protein [Oscillatoriales]
MKLKILTASSSRQVTAPLQGGNGHFTTPDRIPTQTDGAGSSGF